MASLDPRVWLVTYRVLNSEFSGEEDKVLFPRTLTPQLKEHYPDGVVDLPQEHLEHYVHWINRVLVDSQIVNRTMVGCDSTGEKRDNNIVLFVTPWKS